MYYVVRSTMSIVRITRKYQVTIPKKVREKLKLRVGDLLKVEVEEGKIVFRPLTPRSEDPVEELLSLVKEPLDVDAVKLVEGSWDED
ncbi:MAG: AbrB/MazE/SpoVT family DNA-binding domain-containing protein [Thermoprotei archaeon]|nr:MAG: AbrB/MazE/SpoVT family DNA-binding domain-containing protein [Thermoprotei archaeon]